MKKIQKSIKQGDLHNLPAEATLKMLSQLAIIAIIIIVPFAIFNFIKENYLLGTAASVIVGIFVFNAWAITIHNMYFPKVTFWLLVPTIIFFLYIAISVVGVIGVIWTFPAILGLYCLLPIKKAHISNGILLLIIVPSTYMHIDKVTALSAIAAMFLIFIFSSIFMHALNQQQQKLQEQVIRDPLTSLLNRASLKETLEQAIEQSHRANIPMTIAIFDLDHFKKINDLYGHDQGDLILQEVAKIFLQRCRKVDRVFRLGGEEFLIFLYNTDNRESIFIAEELRSLVEESCINNIKVTTSVGLATLKGKENWRSWIKRGDSKQYQAKLLGRNRVIA